LCHGDSLTRWKKLLLVDRYAINERWTGVLQDSLWWEFDIIEEGLRSRSVFGDFEKIEWRNGLSYRYPCILSHLPLDIIILFLWTNDLQKELSHTANELVINLRKYNTKLKQACEEFKTNTPKVILLSPPYIDETLLKEWSVFPVGSWERPKNFAEAYSILAKELWREFLDAWSIIWSGVIDGVHLSLEQNRILWKNIAEKVKKITLFNI
jgi:lysophospholipase L1-like esterase